MKSYTDLEQSKKLAEILPTESADMYYCYGMDINTKKWDYDIAPTIIDTSNKIDDDDIPCWSFAALFDVIPQEIFDGEYVINITEGIDNRWVLTYDHYENRNHSYYGLSTGADNLIDACYEMIIKLHEQKML